MATKIEFLRGQSSALSTLTAPSDGVFYLAEDTRKLNVGLLNDDGTTSIYELNKDITVYSNLQTLEENVSKASKKPKKGSFFYLEEENIFCIYTGTGFTQINPDTGMTAVEDNRSAVKDEDGLDFASQPITSVSYNSTTRKLVVNSGDKFVNIATFKQLKKVVEDHHIIGGVSSEFTITNDKEKILQINAIDSNKITGLSDALNTKVEKKTSSVTQDDGTTKEVDWILLSPENQTKLAALVIGEEGVEISGTVNADNVEGLDSYITNARDRVSGLLSTENETKLKNIENGAQANIIEAIKVNGENLSVVDKTINISTATNEKAGVVVSSQESNKVSVASDGTMNVNNIDFSKLFITSGNTVIFNCGGLIS